MESATALMPPSICFNDILFCLGRTTICQHFINVQGDVQPDKKTNVQ